jgi:hypothetical protein
MTRERRFYAEFMGPSGRVRYVGHGATMPHDKEAARLFETQGEARRALASVSRNHKYGTHEKVRSALFHIVKPAFMVALGL